VEHHYPKQKHNLFYFAVDYVFFSATLGFINLNTIMPAFANRLGASPALVGILITLFSLAWNLPQLLAGNVLAGHHSKKPVLVRAAFMGRPLILAFAVFVILTGGEPAWLTFLAMCLAIMLFFGSDAVASVAWFDILGRAFPPERRGGYISIWQVGKGIALVGVSFLVRYLLSDNGPSFPTNYALLFGAGGIMLLVSAIALTQMYEPRPVEGAPEVSRIPWPDFGKFILRTFKEDRRLGSITLARIFLLLSIMAYPFYVLYATQELHYPEQTIAIFILAQTVGALLASVALGRVANRYGSQRVIQIGAAILLTGPLVALALILAGPNTTGLLRNAYLWIYFCIGLTDNLTVLGYLNYVLDIAPHNQRTIYMGITSTIGSLGVFGPTLGGWLLGATSYTVLFIVSLLLGIGALVMAFRLPYARTTTVSPSHSYQPSQERTG
jgi:MFS family permease